MARLVGLLVALALTLAPFASAIAQAPKPAAQHEWRGNGVVLAVFPPPSDLHPTQPVIVIQHQAIAGLMDEAMAMPFLVASTNLFEGLRAGDRISFVLRDVPNALLVVAIERLPSGR